MASKDVIGCLLVVGLILAFSVPTRTAGAVSVSAPALSLTTVHMNNARVGWAVDTSDGAILRTTDGGMQWHDVTPNSQLLPFRSPNLLANYLSPNVAWVAVTHAYTWTTSLAYTGDGGKVWSTVPLPRHVMDSDIRQILFDGPRDGWVFAASDGDAGSQAVEIFHSTDGGRHWMSMSYADPWQASPGSLPFGGGKDGIAFYTARDGFATAYTYAEYPVAHGLLYVTHDAGRTWQRLDSPLPVPYRQNFGLAGPPQFFTGWDGVLPVDQVRDYGKVGSPAERFFLVTHDGGETWDLTAPLDYDAGGPREWDFLNARYGWALTEPPVKGNTTAPPARLARTQDGGAHWTMFVPNPGLQDISMLNFVTARIGFAVNSRGMLLKTTDGGDTWMMLHPVRAAP